MRITVLMPTYNAEDYVAEAIESVLAQTHRDFEFIIIDDGSTDHTLSIIRSFEQKDARICTIPHEHVGLCGVLNHGLEHASCDWVAIMHADDVMMENRLERQIEFIGEHDEISLASSFVKLINSKSEIVGQGTSELTTHEAVRAIVTSNKAIGFHHPAVIFRKSVVQEVGGYRQPYWPSEDLDLWNRIAERGHGVLVQPEFLVQYRIHAQSASVAHTKLQIQKMRFLQENIERRRRGDGELDWNQFEQSRKERPLLQRFQQCRTEWGQLLYKRAASSFAAGSRFLFAVNLAGSFLLIPIPTSKKIVGKYVQPRLSRLMG